MTQHYPQAVKDRAIQLRLAGKTYRQIATILNPYGGADHTLNWRTIQAWCTNANAVTPAQRRKSGHTVAALRRWVEQFDLREVDLNHAVVGVQLKNGAYMVLQPREEFHP